MSITQILLELAPYRPMSHASLYKHLHRLRIKPLGVRQSPQRYPDDTPNRVLIHLGFKRKSNGRACRAQSRQLRRVA